jgi:hypothetical protein
MALKVSNRTDGAEGVRIIPTMPDFGFGGVRTENVDLIHELDAELRSDEIREDRWIAPSSTWTRVTVKSQVASAAARRMNSPSYLATVRRREAGRLVGLIESLDKHQGRDDFAVCTHPIVEGIKGLLSKLLDADQEGNTREILRRLRDTFLDGGWNRYREKAAREIAARVLRFLADAEEVNPGHAATYFELMCDGGLEPVGIPLFGIEGDDLQGDGDEEDEVLD